MFFPSFVLLKWFFISFGASFTLQPFDKCIKKFHQNLGMTYDLPKSLLCKNMFCSLEILSSTPIFQIWSSGQFCTTTYLNISLKLPPKFGEVSRSILSTFMQKNSCVLWKFWMNQPNSHSGPTWGFVLQPYFYLLFCPWFFFILEVLPTKPLSPGEWPLWRILSACNETSFFLSKTVVLQNLH